LPKCDIHHDLPLNVGEIAKNIEKEIRKRLKKPTGELTKADYEKVTWLELNLHGNQLTDVKVLEKLTKLRSLNLRNTTPTVEGLEKFDQLTALRIYGNTLTEIPKGLEKLTKLKTLNCSHTKLTDLTPLAGLTRLEYIELNYNLLESDQLKHLAKLTQLRELRLTGNQITDLTPLAGLTQLTHLIFSRNNITDLTPLAGLTKLIVIELHLNDNLTKAQIAKLQKALPKLRIHASPNN